jgi:tripartite ATP-independent transporter DctP family solute receptor
MKKALVFTITLLLLCGTLFAGGQQDAKGTGDTAMELKPVKLTWSTIGQADTAQGKGMQKFKFEVERLSEGRITVDLYNAGQIFTQEQELAAAREGSLDIANYAPNWVAEFVPYTSMLGAVYTFTGYDHMRAVYSGDIGKKIFEDVAKTVGVRPLTAFYLGTRQLNVVEKVGPVRTPEQMKGVKLRVPNSPAWIALGKALGGSPTPMSFGEVYLGLKTGVVEGQDNPIPTDVIQKFYEVTKYIILTDHVVDTVWPSINVAKWNSLTKTDQDIIIQAMESARQYNDELQLGREKSDMELLKKNGIVFVTDPDKDAFQKYARWSYENESKEISKTFDWDLYDRIQAAKP